MHTGIHDMHTCVFAYTNVITINVFQYFDAISKGSFSVFLLQLLSFYDERLQYGY